MKKEPPIIQGKTCQEKKFSHLYLRPIRSGTIRVLTFGDKICSHLFNLISTENTSTFWFSSPFIPLFVCPSKILIPLSYLVRLYGSVLSQNLIMVIINSRIPHPTMMWCVLPFVIVHSYFEIHQFYLFFAIWSMINLFHVSLYRVNFKEIIFFKFREDGRTFFARV